MAFSYGIENKLPIHYAADIQGPLYFNDRTYIQEPPMKKEKIHNLDFQGIDSLLYFR